MKRSPVLRSLSSEHHTALVLARRAALAITSEEVADTWKDMAHRFRDELEPHFHKEEWELLPLLAQAGEMSLVQRTLDEHAQLRALAYAGAHDAATLQQLGALLKAHVRFEERELFEVAQELPSFSLWETP